MQCGHYVSRACLPLRYDEKNCNCQCPRCNVFLHGNLIDYRIALVEKYGDTVVDGLEARRLWRDARLMELALHKRRTARDA